MASCINKASTPITVVLLLGFVRYVHSYGVISLPAYGGSEWEDFLESVDITPTMPVSFEFRRHFNQEYDRWEIVPQEHDEIANAFKRYAPVDRETGRMKFDETSNMGISTHREYGDLLEAMFIIGYSIGGFYEF